MARLDVNLRDFNHQSDRLLSLIDNLGSLNPRYQKMVAELVMVRLFSLVESHFESITTKILCATPYVDGTSPVLLFESANASNARSNMLRYGRRSAKNQLRWTKVTFIQDNVIHLLDGSDHLLRVLTTHSSFIEEMRCVRNHVAHNTSDTRARYRPVVERYYGAYVPRITPGVLLLTSRIAPLLIRQYILKSRFVIREIVRG